MDNKTIVAPLQAGSKGVFGHPDSELIKEGKARRRAKLAEWAKLPLRQAWMDEEFMRGHLRRAGIVPSSNVEPATVRRMQILLRRAGILQADIEEAIGCNLAHYLELNNNLPLWVALAHILEASGKFEVSAES